MIAEFLKTWLAVATLLPLLSFFLILILGNQMRPRVSAWIATTAITLSGLISLWMLALWVGTHYPAEEHHAHAEHGAAHGEDPHHEGEKHEGEKHNGEKHNGGGEKQDEGAAGPEGETGAAGADEHEKPAYSAVYYDLGIAGSLVLQISCYIDALTIAMFAMVTVIATCIHVYAMGYMHDEEAETVTDSEVTLADGEHLKRPGRYHRFFQSMSLFCFSMLGLVLSGNIAMVFVFWELVGICSYFLIGFYIERKSASTAANKAFIVNRIGDFGMIIGLMALWSGVGTFAFGDTVVHDEAGHAQVVEQGIFSLMRPGPDHQLRVLGDGMVQFAAREEVGEVVLALGPEATAEQIQAAVETDTPAWRAKDGGWGAPYGYWMLIIAGLGIFCGCVGKSAQFPLHVWLPDAMEGPTPVSALVHSATMVAAGVYLVGRFFPVFLPEVLLVIAIVGCITLFLAATIAITATDIKRVLAYSTISQLGYMMLALGIGGWLPGLMHLITHAFFKSLLFLCSGSVIHGVHTNDMTQMGGLRKKMPITAATMLVGCLAIAGAGIPFVVGFSGYYSKDIILEQAFSFMTVNAGVGTLFFAAAAGGAAITSFYMFRLWFMTFAGKPRDQHRYDHAHESPANMYMPLVILSVFAVAVAWSSFEAYLVGAAGLVVTGIVALVWGLQGRLSDGAGSHEETAGSNAVEAHGEEHAHDEHHAHGEHHGALSISPRAALLASALFFGGVLCFTVLWSQGSYYVVLQNLIGQARPSGTLAETTGVLTSLIWPDEFDSHAYKVPVTILASGTAAGGFVLALLMYGLGYLNPADVSRQFQPVYRLLLNKWWFDELYQRVFVKPTLVISGWFSWLDRNLLDGLLHLIAGSCVQLAILWDRIFDRFAIDGLVDNVAAWTRSLGRSLRAVQTGGLRQYVMFIVLGVVLIFLFISVFWNPVLAG